MAGYQSIFSGSAATPVVPTGGYRSIFAPTTPSKPEVQQRLVSLARNQEQKQIAPAIKQQQTPSLFSRIKGAATDVENVGKSTIAPVIGADKSIVQGVKTLIPSPTTAVRLVKAAATNNVPAEQTDVNQLKSQMTKSKSVIGNLIQSPFREAASLGASAGGFIGKKAGGKTVTAVKPGAFSLLTGKQPIPTVGTSYEQTKKQSGSPAAIVSTGLNALSLAGPEGALKRGEAPVEESAAEAPKTTPESAKPSATSVKTQSVVGTPTKMPKPKANEEGSIAPAQAIADVKNLLAKSKATKTAGSNVSDKLFNLKQNNTADVNLATKLLKNTKGATSKDWEAAYHYREDPTSPVTPLQKSLHDDVVKPLYDAVAKDSEPNTYQHRINLDKRGAVQSILKGDVKGLGGSLLRKTTDSDKTRTMKKLVDESGNETVVSIKTPKDALGYASGPKQVTAFNNKQASNLGTLKIKSKEDLLSKEVKPYQAKLKTLQKQWDSLQNVRTSGGVSRARIDTLARKTALLHDSQNFGEGLSGADKRSLIRANTQLQELTRIKPTTTNVPGRAAKISQKIGDINKSLEDIHSKYNPNELNDKVFVDKNGKRYSIQEATTKQIEQHTNIKYSHHALLNATTHFLQTRSAQRAEQFLNDWKTSPEFKTVARKADESNIPDHYVPSQSLQFRGYVFEPRVAHYLDDFAGQYNKDPLKAITGLNKFLTTTIFVNPLVHIPNEIFSALVNRGLTGNVPGVGLGRGIKTAGRAIKSVIKDDELQQDLQRAGMPTMSRGAEEFTHTMGKLVAKQMRDPNIESRLIKAGISSPKRVAQFWMHEAHKMTWITQDIFNTQAVLENEAKGMSREAAIKRAFTNGSGGIPDYRPPTTLLGSRKAKELVFNPNISVFSSYHYSILKSYMNIAKQLVARDSTIKDRANALDKLAMMGITALVLYPQLDKLVKHITGNPNAEVRRAGPLTIPYAAYEASRGKSNYGRVAQDVVTPPPGTSTVLQLKNNKDAFGNQIFIPGEATSNPKQFATDVGKYAAGAISPVGQVERGIKKPGKTIASLLGVSSPSPALDNKVYALLGQQFGGGGMSVEQKRISDKENAARQQIASGKGDGLAKQLLANGTITDKTKFKEFESKAKWTPVQRAFDTLSASDKSQILSGAKPEDVKRMIGNKQSLLVSLSNTAQNKSAKPANRQAATKLIKQLGGDQFSLYNVYKQQRAQTRRKAKSGFPQP